ncbi:MAG: 4Fe-4S ferredoxin, partial [Candidatus Thermoplasmatota archaeon]|nr:4Fe-4S ferredoxin [Candidatus Thermoplasmatota archaeon]
IPFLALFMRDIFLEDQDASRRFLMVFTSVFVILDEVLMSLVFNLVLSHQQYLALMSTSPVAAIFQSVSSYWFVFPMSIEMFLSIILMRRDQNSWTLVLLLAQASIMFLAPPAVTGHHWGPLMVYLSGAVMTGFFVFLFEHLYRAQSVRRSMGSYILMLLAVYTAMMAGVFLWQVYGSIYLFSMEMIADMVLYLWGTLHRGMLSTGPRTYWLANRRWSFSFLLLVFAAEFFMGAAFDIQYYGAVPFIASTGIVPLTGSMLSIAGKAVFDFFIFFGSVSLSSWFLVMMGIEMGSLVVFKIRKTREMETRIRLSLMLVAYGIYSILLPSFIIQNPASVPFIGWSMGIGTAGPVSPLLILPMVLTYVISGILSLLFGSRQLCSVFCTAPVMYQGTFYDSMKKFNNSSGMSKSLTRADRTGNMVYRIVSNMVYVSVIAAAVISWLDSTGRLNLTFYGTDPEYMLYIFYFGFLWYAVFILMPYVGSYGCINTGYCQWGNFNRFISRFGFFRLKVRDPNQCVTCPTKDCASACPVGNYGQPGSFITKGEYKDSRCVGIGDCVNACPYENIFYYDVRHFVREKISKK